MLFSQDQPVRAFVNFTMLESSKIQTVEANWFKMDQLKEVNRYVYWAEVTGLIPGKAYSFIPGCLYSSIHSNYLISL